MQHIDWHTQSVDELTNWCLARHYRADLYCSSRSGWHMRYRSQIISDRDISLARTSCAGALKLRRGFEHIRADGVGGFTIYYPLQRPLRFMQNGMEQTAQPGEFFFLRGDVPLRLESFGDAAEPSEMLYMSLPAQQLRALLADIDRFCGRTFPLGTGLGRATRDLLARDLFEARGGDPLFSERMLLKMVDLGLEAVAEKIRAFAGDELAPEDMQKTHLDRLHRHIGAHLGDKQLKAHLVASACGISTRYLHLIMERSGTSFARYLWAQRLERARSWLQDPEQRYRTIEQIASSVGFTSSSHFSRAFKARYGLSPKAARRVPMSPAHLEYDSERNLSGLPRTEH